METWHLITNSWLCMKMKMHFFLYSVIQQTSVDGVKILMFLAWVCNVTNTNWSVKKNLTVSTPWVVWVSGILQGVITFWWRLIVWQSPETCGRSHVWCNIWKHLMKYSHLKGWTYHRYPRLNNYLRLTICDFTETSVTWRSWRLKSPATRQFAQQYVLVTAKQTPKLPITGPLWRKQ